MRNYFTQYDKLVLIFVLRNHVLLFSCFYKGTHMCALHFPSVLRGESVTFYNQRPFEKSNRDIERIKCWDRRSYSWTYNNKKNIINIPWNSTSVFVWLRIPDSMKSAFCLIQTLMSISLDKSPTGNSWKQLRNVDAAGTDNDVQAVLFLCH